MTPIRSGEAFGKESALTEPDSLNPNHKRRLLVSCKYIDKLLSDIETVLNVTASNSLFGKYRDDLAGVQRKVIQDYITRIRAQMARVLDGQDIALPEPDIGAIHSIRTTLDFVDVAAEELRPKYMRGYGKVPESLMPELEGVSAELQGLVQKLNSYLAEETGADLQARLAKLDQTIDEIELLKAIERIVMEHGLVEFRATVSTIVDRLEEDVFEIALFGRVSSGKSSLLNHIVQSDVLPVGVNPITAIPTRVAYGPAPIVRVWFPGRRAEQFPIESLSDFVTEQNNPSNSRHISRILVELPSRRLESGVVFVDTPGLGSLATAGAAETLAYLPHCDLGVVLIDAGSTLTQEDILTIQRLYEAGTPALVLLSKADLLAAADRERAVAYISDQIRLQLKLEVSVRPVSATDEYAGLLDRWFEDEILPLYEQHRQLARQSLRRKIGSLRDSVAAALRLRLKHAHGDSLKKRCDPKKIEGELRNAEGEFEEARRVCVNFAREFSGVADSVVARTADEIAKHWSRDTKERSHLASVVTATLDRLIAETVRPLHEALTTAARQLAGALKNASDALEFNDAPPEEQLTAGLREMPRFELGDVLPELHVPALVAWNRGLSTRWIRRRLRAQSGPRLADALSSYEKLLEDWTLKKCNEIKQRFSTYADTYRAQLEQLARDPQGLLDREDELRRDLDLLTEWDVREKAPAPRSSAESLPVV
jgi:GTP-binding protein EngB required for normal cell division